MCEILEHDDDVYDVHDYDNATSCCIVFSAPVAAVAVASFSVLFLLRLLSRLLYII